MRASGIALRLFVSEDCELCDCAVAVLAQARAPEFECVNIEGDAELEKRYDVRVPVLCDINEERELGWPFGVEDVRNFLDMCTGAPQVR